MPAPQAAAVGGSKLAASVLGPWARAPKAAREDYERYIAAVAALLGGEADGEEVQEAAAAAYGILQSAPPAAKLKGRGSVAALNPIRCVSLKIGCRAPVQSRSPTSLFIYRPITVIFKYRCIP